MVSTDHEKQDESLENKISYYERIIGANPEYEFASAFADRGISGTTDNRPEFKRMLELASEGAIDVIITKAIINEYYENQGPGVIVLFTFSPSLYNIY
ncbi:hypothetical protein GCM10011351_06600 [Paraliobacillus quinghaiensis]|uniref:Resolvase/invertase-type recombinase catalytic domain-containing protein n=1 Tax=Paraliobacillus quinghaiensis TaxID=470815 RepID=A0A917TI64_9BACI|nr:recombinase family protein [Paraliobacillus quinghaiensis]GGM23496.1 hypothetical protein GCM10011351_06600 [Paraliobacillus quinghaiensis]